MSQVIKNDYLDLSTTRLFDNQASMDNGSDKADRTISTGKLNALLHLHTQPINVVVFHGSGREYSF